MASRRNLGNIYSIVDIETDQWDRKVGKLLKDAKKIGRDLEQSGRTMSAAFSVPLAAIGGLAVKSAISFESAFAGVRKTVDASAPKMEELRQSILKMSTSLPSSVEELSKFAQLGGQFGIPAEKLGKFAEVMSRVQASFDDIDPNVAAEKMAQFAGVMQLPIDNLSNLASAIGQLADDTETSEGPIIEMMARIAGAAKNADISAAATVGLAGAFARVGIEAEMGGTAMQKIIIKFQKAAETGAGLEELTKVLGVTSEQFKTTFKQDAAESITQFIEKLGEIKANGGSVLQVLDDMGIKGALLTQSILRAAGSGDKFRQSIEISKAAYETNNKLLNESAIRFGTLENQIKILWNTFRVFLIQIGEDMMPTMKSATKTLTDLALSFQGLDPNARKSAIAFGVVLAAAGPVVLLTGKLIAGFAAINPVVLAAAVAFASLAAAWNNPDFRNGLNIIGEKVYDLELKFQSWNNEVRNALATALIVIKKTFLSDIPNAISESVSVLSQEFKRMYEECIQWVSKLVTESKEWLGDKLASYVVEPVKGTIDKVTGFFAGMYDAVVGHSWVPDMVDEVGDWFSKLDQYMVSPTEDATQGVSDLFQSMGSSVTGDFEKINAQIDQIIEKTDTGTGGSFFSGILGDGFKDLGEDSDRFSENLGRSVSNSIANGIEAAFNGGDTKAIIKQFGADLGETLGTAIGGPIGGSIGRVIGGKAGNNLSKFGQSTSGTASALTTAVTFSPWAGDFVGSLFSDQGDSEAQARKAIIQFLENALGRDITAGPRTQFSQDWVSTFQDVAGEGQGAFEALGTALSVFSGQTAEYGSQIGAILAQDLTGNLDEARFMIQDLGLNAQNLEEIFMQAGNSGQQSWAQVVSELDQINTLTGDGLVGIGDVIGAINLLTDSAGTGSRSLQAVHAIAVEAQERGVKSLSALAQYLVSTGQVTQDQVTQLMQAFQDRGITNLDQLRDANDRTLAGIVATLDNSGYAWSEFGGKIDDASGELDRFQEKLSNIDRDLEVKVKIKYESEGTAPDVIKNELGGVYTKRVREFADGGIVDRKSYFLSGDAGGMQLNSMAENNRPEAIVPLDRGADGKLGINAWGMGGDQIVQFNVTVAPGNGGLNAEDIAKALEGVYRSAVRDSVHTVMEMTR